MHIQLGNLDYLILIVYFAFVLGIGWIPVAMVLIRWMSRPDTEP